MKIESLQDYLGKIPEDHWIKLATNIFELTESICEDYPDYKEWYFHRQLPAIMSNERNILFVRNPQNSDKIIAMACLKRNQEEQKNCTLYVCNQYRRLGIGTRIVEESIIWLGNPKPVITFADYKLEMFQSIIRNFHWELTEVVKNKYNNHSVELYFNGRLQKK